MNDDPGRWYGESDGDIHNRTFYAYRENSAFPGGVERKDFDTKAQLNKFFSTVETPIIKPTRHDFPEDFQSPAVEHGIYSNMCRKCNAEINGGKYRRICKVCFDAAVENVKQQKEQAPIDAVMDVIKGEVNQARSAIKDGIHEDVAFGVAWMGIKHRLTKLKYPE